MRKLILLLTAAACLSMTGCAAKMVNPSFSASQMQAAYNEHYNYCNSIAFGSTAQPNFVYVPQRSYVSSSSGMIYGPDGNYMYSGSTFYDNSQAYDQARMNNSMSLFMYGYQVNAKREACLSSLGWREEKYLTQAERDRIYGVAPSRLDAARSNLEGNQSGSWSGNDSNNQKPVDMQTHREWVSFRDNGSQYTAITSSSKSTNYTVPANIAVFFSRTNCDAGEIKLIVNESNAKWNFDKISSPGMLRIDKNTVHNMKYNISARDGMMLIEAYLTARADLAKEAKSGKELHIGITPRDNNKLLYYKFSLMGFSDAFNRAQNMCRQLP